MSQVTPTGPQDAAAAAVASATGESVATAEVAQAAKKTNLREYGIVGALIAIVILFQLLTGGKLLMPDNVASLFQQNAYVMILAIGMVMVIIAG
ncbi:MAG TPA: hypothetical protein PKC73_14915, partial [Dermatophilaceae bacterium]|nr:hypothetical protein [Dermatophilaceae bacterium]